VPKKPLASWMTLVAMISVPICARIDPLDGIGHHFTVAQSSASNRSNQRACPLASMPTRTCMPRAGPAVHVFTGSSDLSHNYGKSFYRTGAGW
jgi:hypothetical protein